MQQPTAELQEKLVREARDSAVHMLQAALDNNKECAVQVEKAVWNNAIDVSYERKIKQIWFEPGFRRLYTAKIRSLAYNLGHPGNSDLKRHIFKSLLYPEELVLKSHAELFPGGPYHDMEIQLQQKAAVKESEYADGLMQCGRCKSWKVQWTQIQTRSSDESMTTNCWCPKCNKRWKLY